MPGDLMVGGKIALVTGGGSGIGEATATLFAREGATVVVADVNGDAAAGVAEKLRTNGGEALGLQVDVANRAAVDALIQQVLAQYGRLDCAVNNAGARGTFVKLEDCTDEEWHHVVSVNLDGVFFCLRAEVRAMLRTDGGSIVNIASGATVEAQPLLAPYVAAKSGVVGLTKSAAGQYARDNIRINAVLPGRTITPMFISSLGALNLETLPEGKRFGDPTELAEAIVWMCSPRASFVHGTTLLVDGGGHSYQGEHIIDTRDYEARKEFEAAHAG